MGEVVPTPFADGPVPNDPQGRAREFETRFSLRIKLQNDYRHPRFIATVPGEGYRFIPTFSNLGWDGARYPGEHPRS